MARALCECDMTKLGAPPMTSPKSFEIQMLSGLTVDATTGQKLKDAKARTYPGTGVIQIDKDWWATITPAQRDAVMAHELSHHDDAHACEPCTDARAGSRLRHLGYSRNAAVEAMASLVSNRRRQGEWDSEAVGNGWDAADAYLEDAGDRVESAALWSYPGSLSPSAEKLGEPQGLDEDGQSVGAPDVDGQSVEDVGIDDGQSIGAPGPFNPTPPKKTTPPKTSTPPKTAPAPSPAGSPGGAMAALGLAIVVIAIVLIVKKKG